MKKVSEICIHISDTLNILEVKMTVVNANIEIQKMLYDANLISFSDIDGKIGPKTREAITPFLYENSVDYSKWSSARQLVAVEQLLYKSQKISVGVIDGLVGQQTIHAREVYQANLTLTWRDRFDKIFSASSNIVASPTGGLKPNVHRPIDRFQFMNELKDINSVRAFAGRMSTEVGSQGIESQTAWAETTYNRAASRNKTLVQTVTGKYFPTTDPGTSDNKSFHQTIRDVAISGINTTNGATGNASGMVGFGQGKTIKKDDGTLWAPGQTASFSGERFGVEVADKNWTPKYQGSNDSSSSTSSKKEWPLQRDCTSFYGKIGTNQVVCQVPFPLIIPWEPKTKIKQYSCHKLVKDSMERIWNRTFEHYGYDKILELRINYFGGCLNVRPVRGGTTWSMHSWGIAVDIDPDRNALKTTWKDSQMSKPEYKKFVEFWYDEGFINLGKERNFDSMHFQAARI